jgi:hypothetical protein
VSQDRRHLLVTPCPGPSVSSKTNPITHPAQTHTHLHTLSYRPQVCHGGRIDRYSHSKNNEYTLAQGPPHVPYLGGRQGPPPVIHLVGQAHVFYHKACMGGLIISTTELRRHLISSATRLRAVLISSSTSSGAPHLLFHKLRGALISSSTSSGAPSFPLPQAQGRPHFLFHKTQRRTHLLFHLKSSTLGGGVLHYTQEPSHIFHIRVWLAGWLRNHIKSSTLGGVWLT